MTELETKNLKPETRTPEPGQIEYEFGVAIPGVIKPPEQWARTALKRLPPEGPLNWEALFGRQAPVVVELGCGNGRYTLLSAVQRPTYDHLAADVLAAAVRYATRRANQRGLHNTRFAVKDAETLVEKYLPPGGVTEIHLYHPQPFHNRREAKRRLVRPGFLAGVHRALRPGGIFFVQTDCVEYWKYMKKVLPAFFRLQEQDGPWPDAPEGRSRREIVARQRGLKVYRGCCTRRDELTEEQVAALVRILPHPTFHSRPPPSGDERRKAKDERRNGPA